jgi:hypothetical protein
VDADALTDGADEAGGLETVTDAVAVGVGDVVVVVVGVGDVVVVVVGVGDVVVVGVVVGDVVAVWVGAVDACVAGDVVAG